MHLPGRHGDIVTLSAPLNVSRRHP